MKASPMKGWMKKAISIVAACTLCTIALAGCSSSDSTSSSTNTPTSYQEDLRVALTAQPPTLDPLMTVSNVTAEVGNNIWESLYAMDDQYTPQPVLAKSVDVSDDGLVYTFTLRNDVKFHDGTSMTADDVVASMNRWLTLNNRAKALFTGAEFAKKSDTEVTFTVAEASSDVLIVLASYQQFAAVMPQSVIESAGENGVTEFIGTGPYKYAEWAQDQYIKLEKFDDYTAPAGTASGYAGKRDPKSDNLYYQIAPDASTLVANLQTGAYDIAGSVPADYYDQVANDSALKLYTNTGGSLTLFMNPTSESRLNDDLRQAVLATMDDDAIMMAAYGNKDLYTLEGGFMNPSMSQWDVNGGLDLYNQNDPDKARELIQASGYNGQTLRLLTTPDYETMYNATVVLQEQLRQVGIESEIESYEFATMMAKLADPSAWDIMIASQSYQMTPSQLNIVNPTFAGLDNAQIAAGIEKTRTAQTSEEAKEAWNEVQTLLYEDGIGAVIGHSVSLTVTQSTVDGFDNFIVPIAYNAYIPE